MFPVGVSAHHLSPDICSYRGGDAFFSYCPFSPHPSCFLVRKEIHQVLLLMDKSPHTQEGMLAQSSRLLKAVLPAFLLFTADHCSIPGSMWVPMIQIRTYQAFHTNTFSHSQSKCWFGLNSECVGLSHTQNDKGCRGPLCHPRRVKTLLYRDNPVGHLIISIIHVCMIL